MVEASYVGTRGRDLLNRRNGNVMPYGALSTGTFRGVDLSVPVNRVAVASVGDNLASFRPYNALGGITLFNFNGETDYDSMQLTLSRQTGRRLQYFVAYTLGRTKGTLGDEYAIIDPYDPGRCLRRVGPGSHARPERVVERVSAGRGPRRDEQRHRPRPAEWMAALGHLVDGERDSHQAPLCGDAAAESISAAYFGTSDVVGPSLSADGDGLSPAYTCDPRLGGTGIGEKILDAGCIAVPAFGQNGELVPPYNIRTPTRFNHDVTLFKNF